MQSRISTLIQAIRHAKQFSITNVGSKHPNLVEEYVEAELNCPVTFENVMGLTMADFPEADELTDDELLQIIAALDETFAVFDYWVEMPDNIPLNLKYELYRDLFSGAHYLISGITCHFDFCTGYCPGCKVAKFCDSCITDGWD